MNYQFQYRLNKVEKRSSEKDKYLTNQQQAAPFSSHPTTQTGRLRSMYVVLNSAGGLYLSACDRIRKEMNFTEE